MDPLKGPLKLPIRVIFVTEFEVCLGSRFVLYVNIAFLNENQVC